MFGAFPYIGTGGSTSTMSLWHLMRVAGASARQTLVTTAARRWNVPTSECRTADAAVLHPSGGRRWGYAELAHEAFDVPPLSEVRLKPRDGWTVIGRPGAGSTCRPNSLARRCSASTS